MANDLTRKEPAEKVLQKYDSNSLPAAMAAHHPIHGLFGAAFEEVGGHERFKKWAEENYTDFIKLFSRMAPPPSSDVSIKQMNISVSPDLRKTPLDGELD